MRQTLFVQGYLSGWLWRIDFVDDRTMLVASLTSRVHYRTEFHAENAGRRWAEALHLVLEPETIRSDPRG